MNNKKVIKPITNDKAESSKMAQQLDKIEEDVISININNNLEKIESINKGISNLITLHCRLWLDQNTYIPLAATLDTGSTKSIIGYNLIPKKFHKKLNYNIQTRTVENRIITITHQVEALGIQFLDFAKNYSSMWAFRSSN